MVSGDKKLVNCVLVHESNEVCNEEFKLGANELYIG